MNISQLLFVGAVLGATTASAQEACPGGTQVGQNCGGGYCVPICAYGESPQRVQAPPPRVVQTWEVFDDRFGAIALDTKTAGFFTSSGEPSREAAEQDVLRRCQQERLECDMLGHVKNGCLTLAWGGGKALIELGRDERISEQKALRSCNAESGGECEVIKTTCSFPVSRWVDKKPDNWVPRQN